MIGVPLPRTYRSLVAILAASHAVLALVVGLAGLRMIDEMRDVEAQARELYQHPFRAIAACHEARVAATLIRSELLLVQMEREPTGLHLKLDVDELDHQFEGQLDQLEQFFLGDSQQVREVRTLAGRWRERRIALMRMLDDGRYDDARELTLEELSPLSDALMQRLDAIADLTRMKAAFFAEEARRKSTRSVQRMGWLLGLLLVGAVVGAIGVTAAVVSQLRRRDRELARERERIRLLADNVPGMATIVLDSQGRVQTWNEGATRLHGHAAAQILGQPVDLLHTPEQRTEGHATRMLALAQAKGVLEERGWRQRQDGSRYWADVIVSPLHDEAGRLMGFVKVTRDATEAHRLEQDLVAARDRAEAASNAKSRFLANMSHEVRTPLNAIIGLTELVLDGPLDPAQREHLGKVRRSSRALLGVLNDLLDYAKVEAGELAFEHTELDVPEVVRQCAELFAASASQKGLALRVAIDPAVPHALRGDPLRLSQVLGNLVGNAIKFTRVGEVVLGVALAPDGAAGAGEGSTPGEPRRGETGEATAGEDEVSAAAPGGAARSAPAAGDDGSAVTLRFEVRDTGIGIAPAQAARLFEAFAQADASVTRQYGGTGLGLAICRHLVELMGGRIGVQSQPGQGSCFSFSARFARAPKAAAAGLATAMAEASADPSAAGTQAAGATEAAAGLSLATAAAPSVATSAPASTATPASAAAAASAPAPTPVADAAVPAPAADASAGPASAWRTAALPVAGRRILLVEDDELSQSVAREFLERAGLTVLCVQRGGEALAAIETELFDAVLMDLHMPDMDGLEATRRIRALPGCQALPVIALTAAALPADREAAQAAGMDDHLSKPIDPEALMALLCRHVLAPSPRLAARPAGDGPSAAEADPATMSATLSGAVAAVPSATFAAPRPAPGAALPAAARAQAAAPRPAGTAAQRPATPAFDHTGALERLGGDARVLARLLRRFADNERGAPARLALQLAQGDRRTVIDELHRMAGAAASLGLADVAVVAGRHEQTLRSGELLDPAELEARLALALAQARTALAEAGVPLADDAVMVLQADGMLAAPALARPLATALGASAPAARALVLAPADPASGFSSVDVGSPVVTPVGASDDQPGSESGAIDAISPGLPPGPRTPQDPAGPAQVRPAGQAASPPRAEPAPRATAAAAARAAAPSLAAEDKPPRGARQQALRRLRQTLQGLAPLLRDHDLVPPELLGQLERHTEAWALLLDPHGDSDGEGTVHDAGEVIEALGLLAEQLDAFDYREARDTLGTALDRLEHLHG